MRFQLIAGDLALDFVNTLDNRPNPERHKELLGSYADLADWALQANAISAAKHAVLSRRAKSHPQDAERVRKNGIALRECLYRLLECSVSRRPPPAADLQSFSERLSEAYSRVALKAAKPGHTYELAWDEPSDLTLDSVLWPVVRAAGALLTSPELAKVRECDSASCRWMYVDRSKNHSRRWCDMKVCGNRMKAQNFYRRQRSRRLGSTTLAR